MKKMPMDDKSMADDKMPKTKKMSKKATEQTAMEKAPSPKKKFEPAMTLPRGKC